MMYTSFSRTTFRPPFLPVTDESLRLEQTLNIPALLVPGVYQDGDVPTMGPSVHRGFRNDPELARGRPNASPPCCMPLVTNWC